MKLWAYLHCLFSASHDFGPWLSIVVPDIEEDQPPITYTPSFLRAGRPMIRHTCRRCGTVEDQFGSV
jgi:hypothetical protein